MARFREKANIQENSDSPDDHNIVYNKGIDKKKLGNLGFYAEKVGCHGDNCSEDIPGADIASGACHITAQEKLGGHVDSVDEEYEPERETEVPPEGIVCQKVKGK